MGRTVTRRRRLPLLLGGVGCLVSAAVTEYEGQLATYKGHLPDCPCYRCLFPEPPPPGTVQSCSETGVLGAAGALCIVFAVGHARRSGGANAAG